jgi:hypothetical protein
MAEVNETKQETEGSVTFKRSRTHRARVVKPAAAPAMKNKTLLSFDEDEEM